MRQVIQAVGERMDVHFDRLWQQGEPRATRLVLIGKGLDESAIRSALMAAQVSDVNDVIAETV